MAAVDSVVPSSVQYKKFTSVDVQILISKWQIIFQKQKRLDFDDSHSLSDEEYKAFTSLTKIQFNDLMSRLSTYDIRNSSNRSIRTTIAILLCKLRLGLSNTLLAILFQLSDKRAVSRTVKSARGALMKNFVPYYLGFNHITCHEIIEQKTSTISELLMCDDESNQAIVVADSTYIYIYK